MAWVAVNCHNNNAVLPVFALVCASGTVSQWPHLKIKENYSLFIPAEEPGYDLRSLIETKAKVKPQQMKIGS